MSAMVESLLGDMKTVFGSDFGELDPELLDEARRSMKKFRETLRQMEPELKQARTAHRAARSKKHRAEKRQKETARMAKASDPMNVLRRHGEALRQKKKHAERISRGLEPTGRARPMKRADPKERPGHQSWKGSPTTGPRGHNPFKRKPHLGKGPLSGEMHQTKCWSCRCGNVYTQGCKCTAIGRGANCPTGKEKKVKIHKPYRDAYNSLYHHWRHHKEKQASKRGTI